jgi:hypothetical protein
LEELKDQYFTKGQRETLLKEKSVLLKEEQLLRDQLKEEKKEQKKESKDDKVYHVEIRKITSGSESVTLKVGKWFDLSDSVEFLKSIPTGSSLTRV